MTSFECPWCHAPAAPAQNGDRACGRCARRYTDRGHVRTWTDERPVAASSRDLSTVLLRQLSPLSSRLSPLRYFADRRVEQFYERTLSDRELARKWRAQYLEGLSLPDGAAVLDHGCGRGRNSALLSQLGYQVAAQDIQPHPWWQRLQGCRFQSVPVDAPFLPWADGSFGLVLDVGVVHYVPESRLAVLAAEIYRVLQPGGAWVLLEGNSESAGAHTMRRIIGGLHTVDTMRRVVANGGFEEIDLTYEGYYAPVMPMYVNFVRKLLRPGPVDLNDQDSSLAASIPAQRRALWRMRLSKPRVNG